MIEFLSFSMVMIYPLLAMNFAALVFLCKLARMVYRMAFRRYVFDVSFDLGYRFPHTFYVK